MNTTSIQRSHCVAVIAALCATTHAFAQSRQVPAPPQEAPIAIVGAAIHPVSSDPIERGYVIFDAGKIIAVGAGAPAPRDLPANAVTIDADGLHVYPGLILGSTYLGLTEVGDIAVTNDHTELGRIKPEVRAAVAVNPDSELIPVTRANGILSALVMPRGGLVPGRASVIRLDGWTWEDMAIAPDAGLCISWPRVDGGGGGRRGGGGGGAGGAGSAAGAQQDIEALDQLLIAARAYFTAREHDASVVTDQRFEAMRDVLDGTKPFFISASSIGQIESAVAWSVRNAVKIVIVGGYDADVCAALLTKHDIPVIITGTHRLPSRRHDPHDSSFTLPARLHAAGVRFCMTAGDEAPHDRNLNHMAATSAAYGLDKHQALKSVTLDAANIIGAGEQLGSLESGKNATLIVTSGDPLEITSDTLIAFIDGRRIDLGSKHKSLYAKYEQKYRQMGILDSGVANRKPDGPAGAVGMQ